MLHKTKGIVLRAIKYGETSLVATIFTEVDGVQAYMVRGVRSTKSRQNRAGLFQPGTLLDMVVYQQPDKKLQHIREFQVAHFYSTLQDDVVKNSIMLFSLEVLLRLLPEHAPLPGLFGFADDYLIRLDKMDTGSTANFPLFFIINCGKELGFELKGNYNVQTPYLNLQEGSYTDHAPSSMPFISNEDAMALNLLLEVSDYDSLKQIKMNADMRMRIIDWYILFLQQHTQHMGNIKSLPVLRAILH